jgi:hypothetical protein
MNSVTGLFVLELEVRADGAVDDQVADRQRGRQREHRPTIRGFLNGLSMSVAITCAILRGRTSAERGAGGVLRRKRAERPESPDPDLERTAV